MFSREPHHKAMARAAGLALLAVMLLIAGCKGGSVSGAAGNQVDRTGGAGMQRGGGMDRDNNGGGGY